jgi:hypothetical protein
MSTIIVQLFNSTADDVIKKMKNMRSQYSRELRKQKKKTKSGNKGGGQKVGFSSQSSPF